MSTIHRTYCAVFACLVLAGGPVTWGAFPPPPAVPRPVTYPAAVEKTLANGLRVVAIERRNVPLITAQLVIRSGGEVDPPDKPGLAALTAGLLAQGTTGRTALQIAQATDTLGAELGAQADWDGSVVSVNATTPKFGPAFEVFAEVVRRPAFAEMEIARTKTRTLSALQLTYNDPSALAELVAARVLYGGEAYGHPLTGTPGSVRSVTRGDLVAFYEEYYRPDNAILIIGGDIAPEAVYAAAERAFGDWSNPAAPVRPGQTVSAADGQARVVVVDRPSAGRAALVVGRVGIARSSPDFFAGLVTNAILTGFSGRLNKEVRIKRGLSYGASTQLDARRTPGPFLATTLVDNARVAEGASVVLGTITGVGKEPIDDPELRTRKAALTGSFARELQTIDGLVARVGALALYNIPLTELNFYIQDVEAVKPVEVQRFATTQLGPSSLIIVGNARLFLADLRKRFWKVEVVPFEQLDLGRADLGIQAPP
ncbi:MAG: insulinase family protein [Gemmatimonadaceae bacterium]|nr:insulinase family protein [Gloeobacterales cyanobacterium ES-bin-141]